MGRGMVWGVRVCATGGILLITAASLVAQTPVGVDASRDSVDVAPGLHYAAGSLYRTFLGSGHRELWTTPIRVPIANLDTYAGGLTPVRLGGGTTTRTLHLDGADGRRYVFRSVDKEPADLLQEFLGSPVEGVLRDQMSSFHPSGAVVVARLLDALDVLHATPTLVVVPDDPRLGEFREEFAGMLVLFEERPDDGPDGTAGFADSRRIVQTDDFFDILEEGPQHRLATDELLRARLVDMLVGDRDRSTNNHLWARFEDGAGGFLWRPVPRDRDQAFVQLDGFLKSLARGYEPRLVPFEDEYPNIAGLTRNAWDIDRNFLVGLSRSEWTETVTDVRRRLSDPVIEGAVRRLPAAHFAVVGTELASSLRLRRDGLDEAAEALYGIVFRFADIHATRADETIQVERRPDGSVHVTIRPGDGSALTFDRVFTPDETREVRIYARGGSDETVVTGSGTDDITVRVVGGDGRDRFTNVSTPGSGVNFYDGGAETVVDLAPGTRFHRRHARRPFSWHEESRTLDWGRVWMPRPGFSYDADRGVTTTAGLSIVDYGFLKQPYSSRTDLSVGWAFGLAEPTIDLRRHMPERLVGGDLDLAFRWSGTEILDFFGFGNETPTLGPRSFHRVIHKQVRVGAYWGVGDGAGREFGIGPVFQYLSTDSTSTDTFLGQARPYGSGRFDQVGVRLRFTLDGRNEVGLPSRGYHVSGGAAVFPEMLSVDRGAFGEAHGQLATYLSPEGGNPTLALRVQGKRVWGVYPFADAAFLGGSSSLRGVREQRYAGDATVLGSAEVRLRVARITFPVPGEIGLIALTDRGRVFYDGETSNRWYTAWGGGLSISPLLQPTSLRFTIVRAGSRTAYYVGLGASF